MEALEAYSGTHAETLEELLEWPYRRFVKAFNAWNKRKAIDDIDVKKNLHVASLYTIVEWKEAEDQTKAIEDVEKYYETLKDWVWNPELAAQENKEMQDIEEHDPFLRAGKKNVTAHLQKLPVKQPGQEELERQLDQL